MWFALEYLKQTLFSPVYWEEMEAWSPLPYQAFYLDWVPWTLGFLSIPQQSCKLAEFPPGEGEARMGHTAVSMLNNFCDKGLLQDDFVMKNFDPGHVQLLIDNTKYI